MTDDELDQRWQANEAELIRLYRLPPLERLLSEDRIAELEAEQDRLEIRSGLDGMREDCREITHTKSGAFPN